MGSKPGGTRRSRKDLEVLWEPRARGGAQRSWDHDWRPEAVWEPRDSLMDPEIVVGTRRMCENIGFSLRSRDRIATLTFVFGP
ncbi:hypothetical protein F2Q70_00017498 [Brassica cretica]|uniref:Uncharacterized protein n=1 Tax=Brassica cretica TaxID=69181 RepID=A0A8S9HSD8_BRACR|nr:hypothetical protein F2Q70_00017498 [Brassica cretica]